MNLSHLISHLLLMKYTIQGFEGRGVFLDISKTFDKVWHRGLIFKLEQNSVSSNLLNLL